MNPLRFSCSSLSCPRFAGLALGLLLAASSLPAAPEPAWTDSGAGFRAGTLGNSGQNLYVNRRGELETIRRFDIDGDGHLDLMSNSGHDLGYDIPASVVTATGSSLKVGELDVSGSARVVSADLNKDGFTDLVFLPNRHNVQYGHRSNLTIAWGGPDGWSNARLTRQLPIYGAFGAEDQIIPAQQVAVGDLNGDGWPDILTLNSERWSPAQPEGRIVRAYWGSPDGFLLTHYQDLGIPDATEIATGHFGEQREFSAVVVTSSGAINYLAAEKADGAKSSTLRVARTLQLPAAPSEFGSPKPQCLLAAGGTATTGDALWIGTDSPVLIHVGPAGDAADVHYIRAQSATNLAIGSLDDDEWPDLVLTHAIFNEHSFRQTDTSIAILWGGPDGVSADRTSSLTIPSGMAAAIGDLNGDGHGDLLVSVYQGEHSMKASSRVYLGDGSRKLPQASLPVATEGAQGVAITRLTAKSQPVAIFANSLHFTLDSAVPARIFWGSDNGFSGKAMTELPNLGGLKSSLSDLNADGYVDLIVVNGGDVDEGTIGRAPDVGANIYWGGPEGSIRGPGPTRFDKSRRQVLREPHLCAINVADLNGDGFLDVVLGAYEGEKTTNQTKLSIYYGSAQGLLPENRKTMTMQGRGECCLVADLNRDGHLDIAVTHLYGDEIDIYWGDANGYRVDHHSVMPYPSACGLEAADLNNDGWLDLMVGTYFDPVTHSRDTGMSILWGGPHGYRQSNSQWLPGMAPDSLAAADLDGDGFLDVVVPNYHGELTREDMPSYIYWGSAQGFSVHNRTSLTVNSACDVMIADVNSDGKLDLAFSAHSVNEHHDIDSPIYLNDGNRFRAPQVQYVPVSGPFYGWVQDVGNIYNRRLAENFVSRPFTWTDTSPGGSVTVDAATPFRSHVDVWVRSAADTEALAKASWRKVSDKAFDLPGSHHALQYQLDLVSANGDAYPIVHKVDVNLK